MCIFSGRPLSSVYSRAPLKNNWAMLVCLRRPHTALRLLGRDSQAPAFHFKLKCKILKISREQPCASKKYRCHHVNSGSCISDPCYGAVHTHVILLSYNGANCQSSRSSRCIARIRKCTGPAIYSGGQHYCVTLFSAVFLKNLTQFEFKIACMSQFLSYMYNNKQAFSDEMMYLVDIN